MKRNWVFFRGLASILACIAMGAVSMAGSAQAAESLLVRLDFSPWGMHGAMHLAQQKGWFAEQGLNVDIQDGTGTINTLQLLAAGKVDVGQVSLGAMAVAKEHGLDLISIAGFARTGDLAGMTGKTLNVKKNGRASCRERGCQ